MGWGNPLSKVGNIINDFHPLKGLVPNNAPVLDAMLQGDVNPLGDLQPGNQLYDALGRAGLTEDVLPVLQMFGKAIAGGAFGGEGGGMGGSDLEAAGTSASSASTLAGGSGLDSAGTLSAENDPLAVNPPDTSAGGGTTGTGTPGAPVASATGADPAAPDPSSILPADSDPLAVNFPDSSGTLSAANDPLAVNVGDVTSTGSTMSNAAGGSSGVPDDLGSAWENAAGESSRENAALETANKTAGGGTAATKATPSMTQSVLDKALKYGPLVAMAGGAYQNRQSSRKASAQLGNVGSEQRQVGQQLIADYQAGKLNPADQARIDEWQRGAIAQSRQYFAKAGQSDSTAAMDSERNIAMKAEQMKQQSLQNMLTQGLNALNITDKYQVEAIKAELAGDQATSKSIMDFMNAYGSWMRILPTMTGGGTTTTPTTTPAPTA